MAPKRHTTPASAAIACGHHNRLKEAGFRPLLRDDGRWDPLRPDGTAITPPA